MKKLIFYIASIAMISAGFSSCQKKPSQIVDEIYKASNAKEFSKILPYIVPDSVTPFTDAEKQDFANNMSYKFPDAPMYSSYTIECLDPEDKNATEVSFVVNTNFKDGTSLKEEGKLRKSPNGNWKLAIKWAPTDTVRPYSVADPEKWNPELIRNLRYAYDMVMASRGIPEDQVAASQWYYYGIIPSKDLEKYFELNKNAAEKGNADAMANVAEAYYFGTGVKQDYEKSLEYALKAADAGNGRGMFRAAYQYSNGQGTFKNYEEAAKWYQKATEAGQTNAINNLALMYEKGQGVEKDENKAFELYLKAAQGGDDYGMNNVSWCYQDGQGTEKDMNKAIEWATKSAENGNINGMNHLGDIYYFGSGGTETNYDKAVFWYKKAADKGNAYAEFMMGQCYEYGRGVDRNISLAKEWYRKAHKKDYKPATNALNRLW